MLGSAVVHPRRITMPSVASEGVAHVPDFHDLAANGFTHERQGRWLTTFRNDGGLGFDQDCLVDPQLKVYR